MTDELPATGFAKVDDFRARSELLLRPDYAAQPSPEEDREEDAVLRELCSLLDAYQEQPHLLDPALEYILDPLLVRLRDQVRLPSPPLAGKRLNRLARLIYFVTKVRGSKVVGRFFPHETSDLSLLIPLLSECYSSKSPASPDSSPLPLQAASWELRYVLLVWLSVAIRQPFDLARLDPGAAGKVQQLGFAALSRASKEGDGAGEVLARFYSRQDAPLDNLLQTCEETFSRNDNPVLVTAHLTLLSAVLRDARPAQLLAHWSRLYHLLAFLPSADASCSTPSASKSGASMAKMRCKVAGRLALLKLSEGKGDGAEQAGEADEEDVPEEVEVIVGELLERLGHSDTLPRYSSAKYLSRLCLALPRSFSYQILSATLSSLGEALVEANEQGLADRAEGKVQGACLALGEMARRGLIGRQDEEDGEETMRRVVEGVLQALAFDHLHLTRSLGTSARDSAAYVFWSLSRTLPAAALPQPLAEKVANGLVCTALFDREVQVRRAASAAFQEGVGRWGIFPHGIPVLRQIDFFTVSVRHRAYMEAAPSVASYAEYRPAIVSHLLNTSITHYDADLRALGAKALGKVVAGTLAGEEKTEGEGLVQELVLGQIELVKRTKDINKLHGAVLSLAALADAVEALPSDPSLRDKLLGEVFHTTLSLLSPSSTSLRQLRTSSLLLSAALSALASSAPCLSSASLAQVDQPDGQTWLDLVLLACGQTDEEVHKRAGEASAELTPIFRFSFTLLAELDSRSGTRQQAAVLMLGSVNFGAAAEAASLLETTLQRLVEFVQREGLKKAATIEARRNGVEALAALLASYHSAPSLASLLPSALDALLLGFSDYTTDQRGDVGSWVRISTLTAWSTLLSTLPADKLGQDLVDRVVARMLKQAVERLDNVREVAGAALMRVWEAAGREEEGGRVLLRNAEVWDGIAGEERRQWRDLNWASERLLPLLKVPQYRSELLEGAILSTNQHSSSTPFLDYTLLLPPTPADPSDTSFTLLSLLAALHALAKSNFGSNRLFVPFLHLIAAFAEAGCLDELALEETGEGEKTLKTLLAVATNAVGKMKSPQRLGAAGKVVTSFLAVPRVNAVAVAMIPLFLSHPLGWLRQQFADDLFGQVGALDLADEEGELERLLTETSWSSSVSDDEAKQVSELLQRQLASSAA
ncbi:hypothetical protein JCM8097_006134 [Rhodosporidiobolus ruineniae]